MPGHHHGPIIEQWNECCQRIRELGRLRRQLAEQHARGADVAQALNEVDARLASETKRERELLGKMVSGRPGGGTTG